MVIFYYSEEERLAFETYIEEHNEFLEEKIKEVTRFEGLQTETKTKTEVLKERLKVGYALNEILSLWRSK